MASQKPQREAIRVTVWNEYRHELQDQQVAAIYPQGIHDDPRSINFVAKAVKSSNRDSIWVDM